MSINTWGESIKKTEAGFSHWAPACTARSRRNNPKHRKFHSNIPKSCFHCKGGQAVEQVAQRGILGESRASVDRAGCSGWSQ